MENEPRFIDFLMAMGSVLMIVGLSMFYLFVLHPPKEEPLPELKAEPLPIQEIIEEAPEQTIEEPQAEPAPRIILSDEDMMAKVIMAEAEGEPFLVKVAVAATILNRVDFFGTTVESVITMKDQFSYSISTQATDECYRAVAVAQRERDVFDSRLFFFRAHEYFPEETPITCPYRCEDYFCCGDTYFSLRIEKEN